ncbi:MAG: hypothetical protein WD049_05075 [Candidatus Paceibacterota bacterium]
MRTTLCVFMAVYCVLMSVTTAFGGGIEYVTVPIEVKGEKTVLNIKDWGGKGGAYGVLETPAGDGVDKRAVRLTPDLRIETLPELFQDKDVFTPGISGALSASDDESVVVGFSTTPTGAVHACVWRDGKVIDLGTLGGRKSVASKVSPNGRYGTGFSETDTGDRRAFRIDLEETELRMENLGILPEQQDVRGTVTSLGTIVTKAGVVYGVSGGHQIVGVSAVAFVHDGEMRRYEAPNSPRAIIRNLVGRSKNGHLVGLVQFSAGRSDRPYARKDDLQACLITENGVEQLHTDTSNVIDVNDTPDILGSADGVPVLWQRGEPMRALHSLVDYDLLKVNEPRGKGKIRWTFHSTALDGRGVIACSYQPLTGQVRNFLLVPRAELTPAMRAELKKYEPEPESESPKIETQKTKRQDTDNAPNVFEELEEDSEKTDDSKPNKVIVIIHGLYADADGWVASLVDLFDRELTKRGTRNEWTIMPVDWSQESGAEWDSQSDFPPHPVAPVMEGVNSIVPLAQVLAANEYEVMHIIDHSGGGYLGTEMAKYQPEKVYVQHTALDIFVMNDDTLPLGKYADFAEHYRNPDTFELASIFIRELGGKTGEVLPWCWNKVITTDTLPAHLQIPEDKRTWSTEHAVLHVYYLNSLGTGYGLDLSPALGNPPSHNDPGFARFRDRGNPSGAGNLFEGFLPRPEESAGDEDEEPANIFEGF